VCLWSLLTLSLTIAGCSLPRQNLIPMKVLRDHSGCATSASTLVVMLPGAYSLPEEFVQEGFVADLRRHSAATDVVMVDAHLGYFTDRSVLRRLRDDVVLPGRAAGYRSIWLVGISLGGFAALGYATRHGEDIDGVLAIAPYPGTAALQREIALAGGPQAWASAAGETAAVAKAGGQAVASPQPVQAPRADDHAASNVAAKPEPDDLERDIWQWLATGAGAAKPLVYLGYGQDDRFAKGLQTLATTLPPAQITAVPGGHDWAPWRALWGGWLERGLLRADDCPAPAATVL
jgi:pimeloyl-ACP methyl ester carboxylesterase